MRSFMSRTLNPSHKNINNGKSKKLSCIIITFLMIVLILILMLIYFAATFPEPVIEQNEDSDLSQQIKAVTTITQTTKAHFSAPSQTNKPLQSFHHQNKNKNMDYNKSHSIHLRLRHKSSVQLQATPFLVGLGAEKSGSTSLGAAIFNSREFSCPEPDEINVETKYWSDCFGWNAQNDLNALIEKLKKKNGGHCSIKQYESWQRWKNGKYKFEKSVDYFGLPYVTKIFSDIFVKEHGTKIFVMIRYPPPRISSTWKFFVGAEKDKMPNEYGNVESFTKHLLKNEELNELLQLLRMENGKNVFDLDWSNVILPKWNEYMQSLQRQCKKEAPIAGFKAVYCNPSQLLRRAVGLSCYIVPIMQWIVDLGIENALNSFRIIQSELYFKDGRDIMDRLICWSKQGTMNVNECETDKFYENGSVKIKKLQGTIKNAKLKDFSDELIDRLHDVFTPCNERLFQLLQMYPQLALKEFDWNDWHFTPAMMS